MINVLLAGASGVMGHMVYTEIAKMSDIQVAAGIDLQSCSDLPFPLYQNPGDVQEEVDVLVDFSHPSALTPILEYCVAKHLPAIICTTGHTEEQRNSIIRAGEQISVFFSANMSLGVNLMKGLVQQAAMALGDFDIEILEKHHNRKADAPSGTAILLADAINEILDYSKEYIYERHSRSSSRGKQELGISSIRGGTTAGEHSVEFYGPDEVFVLTHIANSRVVFATGAIKAMRYIIGMPPGHYTMDDLLLKQN